MLKKMTLLAMAVGALVAFAIPAVASAEGGWKTNGELLGESTEEGEAVHFTGTLSWTKGSLKFSCDVTANTVLWNEGGVGVGHATLTLSADPTATGACTVAVFVNPVGYVDLAECHFNPIVNGENWPVTTSHVAGPPTAKHVTVSEFAFTYEVVGADCEKVLGIKSGTKVSDEGAATGRFEGECIVFNNSGTFVGGSTIDGSLCPTNNPGLQLTF